MELGARLRQARLDAGMSQRQLCGDVITRNMLSQIENGSARPSVETMVYIAGRLGKPVSYFLEDQPEGSPNQRLIFQLRKAEPEQLLAMLEEYEAPDELLDPERYWLEAMACLTLAEQAVEAGKLRYAAQLLEQAQQAGDKTPYYTQQTRRQWLLLCHRAKTHPSADLAAQLPPLDGELLLRGQAALESGDPAACKALLEGVQQRQAQWYFLMGTALLRLGEYENAAACLEKAESWDKKQVYSALEQCYTAREDYKMAYAYACKLRDLEKGNTIFFAQPDV